MKWTQERDLNMVRAFRRGATRRVIANAWFVSLSTVDRAIRKYVKPGGR